MKGHVDGGLRVWRIQGALGSLDFKLFYVSFTFPLRESAGTVP